MVWGTSGWHVAPLNRVSGLRNRDVGRCTGALGACSTFKMGSIAMPGIFVAPVIAFRCSRGFLVSLEVAQNPELRELLPGAPSQGRSGGTLNKASRQPGIAGLHPLPTDAILSQIPHLVLFPDHPPRGALPGYIHLACLKRKLRSATMRTGPTCDMGSVGQCLGWVGLQRRPS